MHPCFVLIVFSLKKLVTEGLYPTDNRFRTGIMDIFLAALEFPVMFIFACHSNVNTRITEVC